VLFGCALRSLMCPFGPAALVLVGVGCARASFAPVPDAAQADVLLDPPVDVPDAASAASLDAFAERAAQCPAPSLPGCAPAGAGACDPVCQTGGCDWCSQKCSFAYTPDGGVAPTCTRKGTAVFPQACSSTAAGSVRQSDDCAPGSVCLPPVIGDRPTYCFALCRSRADCTYAVECAPRTLSAAGGLVSVCDPPYDQCGRDGTCCDPIANQGCGANRVCLLVSPDLGSGHSRTVCELSFGDGRNGSPCASARDCQLRNTCVAGACREVCSDTAPCPTGLSCVDYGSELGYCA
jgi:hypothetical protein